MPIHHLDFPTGLLIKTFFYPAIKDQLVFQTFFLYSFPKGLLEWSFFPTQKDQLVSSDHCKSYFFIRKIRRRMRIFIYTYLLRPHLKMKELKSRVFVIYKLTLKVPSQDCRKRTANYRTPVNVPSHNCRKRKAENEQPITEYLKEERNLKIFCNWLSVFCFAFSAIMQSHLQKKEI